MTRSEDARLARLHAMGDGPATPELRAELREIFKKSSHHVVAKAAEIAARLKLIELAPDMVLAFDRFLVDPQKTDKQCIGKIAIVEALEAMEFDEPDVFHKGLRYVQMEAVWGGREDSACRVRAVSAMALIRIGRRGALAAVSDLLADPSRSVRIAAAQAIECSGTESASLLLRLKARLGDDDAEVIGECLAGLLRLDPLESVPLVAEFLKAEDPAVAESALLALGNSRRAEAWEVLKDFWKDAPSDLQQAGLLAIALLRLPVAIDFLLSLLAEAPEPTAIQGLSALSIYAHDSRVRDRIAAAARKRGPSLEKAFAEIF